MSKILISFVLCLFCCGSVMAQETSLRFDGNDFATIPDPLNHAGGAFTLEAWVKIDSMNGGRVLCNRESGNGYEIFYSDSEMIIASSINGGWDAQGAYPGLHTWFHVAWTYSGSPDRNSTLYINGQ